MNPEFVYAVAYSDNSFMMVYNGKRNGWEFPGGRLEAGESPEQAIHREFLEETGHILEIHGQKEFPAGSATVFYGAVGERTGVITDPAIDRAGLFSSPPVPLAFGLEECIRLLEAGCSVVSRPDASSEDV